MRRAIGFVAHSQAWSRSSNELRPKRGDSAQRVASPAVWLGEAVARERDGATASPSQTAGEATRCAESPRFGLSSLLDLLQAWLCATNPIARLIHVILVHRDRPRNFLPSRNHPPLELHRFSAFDRELPMMPETVKCIKHRLRFHSTYATAAHRVVKHPIAVLPRALVLLIGNVVQNGSVPIFSFKWSAH